MKVDALLLCGYTFEKNTYNKMLSTAPKEWTFHSLNYPEILHHGTNSTVHEAIKKYIKIHQLNKVCLIAHSLGGAFAIDFAFYYPEMVKQIYLLNTIGSNNPATLVQFIQNLILSKRHNFSKHLKNDIKGFINIVSNPLDHFKLLKFARSINLEEKAAKLSIPTTIIWGEKDYLIPLSIGEKLHVLIPNSRFIVLKGMDHDWPVHSPELFWNNIK